MMPAQRQYLLPQGFAGRCAALAGVVNCPRGVNITARSCPDAVREITAKVWSRHSQRSVTAEYGVASVTVSRIVRGQSWRWMQCDSGFVASSHEVRGVRAAASRRR